MSKKQTTVLMAAVLAVATVLAAGLTVLPGSVQEAQANPCASESNVETETGATITVTPSISVDERECDLTGNFEFDED
jgi:hypothetical protein